MQGLATKLPSSLLVAICSSSPVFAAYVVQPRASARLVSSSSVRGMCLRDARDWPRTTQYRRFAQSGVLYFKAQNSNKDSTVQDISSQNTLKRTEEWDVPDTYQRYQGEIFCNRALNMKRIRAVGFDMDYTLAQYIPETFEILGSNSRRFFIIVFLETDTFFQRIVAPWKNWSILWAIHRRFSLSQITTRTFFSGV